MCVTPLLFRGKKKGGKSFALLVFLGLNLTLGASIQYAEPKLFKLGVKL